jgi:hypothetical protein
MIAGDGVAAVNLCPARQYPADQMSFSLSEATRTAGLGVPFRLELSPDDLVRDNVN